MPIGVNLLQKELRFNPRFPVKASRTERHTEASNPTIQL